MDLLTGYYRAIEVSERTGKPHIYPCHNGAGTPCVMVNAVGAVDVDIDLLVKVAEIERSWYPERRR